jgi:hypothetical protein
MLASEIFAGPIVRRAQTDMIAIWVATTKRFDLLFTVRPVGAPAWTGQSTDWTRIRVFEDLWINLGLVVPLAGKFSASTLFEYSIGVVTDDVADHAPFAKIVKEDQLSYDGLELPTFFLQGPNDKLNAIYASCRKFFDDAGGDDLRDAMAYADELIASGPKNLAVRPAILCLTGDQIYADDVDDVTFDVVQKVAKSLEHADVEHLPQRLVLPGKGQRQSFLEKNARFTSGAAANHVITFAEYVAMYGLAWMPRLWPSSTGDKKIDAYLRDLPKIRRLLANTPTYMIFDDHDVTDDWNFSVEWIKNVNATPLGRRVIVNALHAFWLFQGWGNDPDRERSILPGMIEANDARLTDMKKIELLYDTKSAGNGWEFFTPTYPFIYFLDTRTQRGYRDDFTRSDGGAPAFLKSIAAWKLTLARLTPLLRRQGTRYPLVLVAPAPVWGYDTIDALQREVSNVVGPYTYDQEGWATNRSHLLTFLLLCGNADVVILSGDVHYAHTSTAHFNVFDSAFYRLSLLRLPGVQSPKQGSGNVPTYHFLYRSRFIQLTASAAKNFASGFLGVVAALSGEHGHIIDELTRVRTGFLRNEELRIRQTDLDSGGPLITADPKAVRPICGIWQRVNDATNTPYNGRHNVGYVTLNGRRVDNAFLVNGRPVGQRSWDFAVSTTWEPKP